MARKADLIALAEANDVELESGATVADIEEALAEAGVEIPESGSSTKREPFSIIPANEIDQLEGLKLSALPKSELYAVKYSAEDGFSAEPYKAPKAKKGDE
jgi:hypothetical protein